jgi:hypothetical protein
MKNPTAFAPRANGNGVPVVDSTGTEQLSLESEWLDRCRLSARPVSTWAEHHGGFPSANRCHTFRLTLGDGSRRKRLRTGQGRHREGVTGREPERAFEPEQ